jgi:hypothetical protein
MEMSKGQRFGEHINKLIMTVGVMSLDNLRLNLLTNKVIINLNVFYSFMKHKISCNMHGNLVVTKQGHRDTTWKTQFK